MTGHDNKWKLYFIIEDFFESETLTPEVAAESMGVLDCFENEKLIGSWKRKKKQWVLCDEDFSFAPFVMAL